MGKPYRQVIEMNLMKGFRGGVVSGSVSEFSDMDEEDDDRFTMNDIDDDDTFELPLKANHSRSNNFSALTDDCGSLRSCSSNSIDKKVRFEPGDCGNEHIYRSSDGVDSLARSRSNSLKGRKNVEELLHYANQVNEYLAVNLENIDMFRSKVVDSGLPLKSASNDATPTTTVSGSVSNFELSESEIDDVKSGRSTTSELCSDTNVDDEFLLRASLTPQEKSGSSELDSSGGEVEDQDGKPMYPANSEYAGRPLLIESIRQNTTIKSDEDAVQDKLYRKGSLIMSRDMFSDTLSGEMCEEEAIKVFQETIECVLHMSRCNDCEGLDEDSVDQSLDYNSFVMKSLPTLSYQDLINRIHSKCMFSPVVYLASSFLFQVLCLTRREPKGRPCLKHRLEECEIHRLVIACVRIATKITEDYVHSHLYFCKVCGISKRLLSRLEMSLLTCLKNDSFMITAEKLAASPQIRDEIRASTDHHS